MRKVCESHCAKTSIRTWEIWQGGQIIFSIAGICGYRKRGCLIEKNAFIRLAYCQVCGLLS